MSSTQRGSILVTGANGGLGCGIVSKICSTAELSGSHGLYIVRNASSADALRAALSNAAPGTHSYDIISLDLSRLSAVREVSASINYRIAAGEILPIRALILNAGYINGIAEEKLSEDGFEITFASNYLGHWLLTLLLLKSVDKENGRVLVVGSNSHEYVLLSARFMSEL